MVAHPSSELRFVRCIRRPSAAGSRGSIPVWSSRERTGPVGGPAEVDTHTVYAGRLGRAQRATKVPELRARAGSKVARKVRALILGPPHVSTGAPQGDVQPGTILAGKYRVERVIGQGGMGRVVEARHVALDDRVAMKFLLPEYASHPEA